MSNSFFKTLKQWIPLAILITCVFCFIYIVQQQSYRLSGNDPQIQMAEDTATLLSQGKPANLSSKIDITESLRSFRMIIDSQGNVIDSEAIVDNQIPTIPQGVFLYAKKHHEDRFTWQPSEGVRIAAVVVHYMGQQEGFVLAGRNIREIEQRETNVGLITLCGWIGSMIAVFITILCTNLL